MKKFIWLFILQVITWIGTGITFIWASVEFLIYLLKDLPFNWTSLITFIVFGVLSILPYIVGVFVLLFTLLENNKPSLLQQQLHAKIKESDFQEKLKEKRNGIKP